MFVSLLQGLDRGAVGRVGLSFPAASGFAYSCLGRMLSPGVEAGASQGPSPWGLAVPQRAIRGCKDPTGTLASKAVCGQGHVCLAWLVQLRSREPRRWGHRQRRRGWPASPSSVRKVRGLCPHGVCAQGPHPCFFLEHEKLPGWGNSDKGVVVGPTPSQGPSRHTALPSLGLGVHSFRPRVVSPTPGSSPRRSVLLSLALLSSRRLTAGLLCHPHVPHVSAGPRAIMLGPLQRCPGAPALIWGWCPEDTAVQALEEGHGVHGAPSRVAEDLSVTCPSAFTHSLS